jgi:hypothetical protein
VFEEKEGTHTGFSPSPDTPLGTPADTSLDTVYRLLQGSRNKDREGRLAYGKE